MMPWLKVGAGLVVVLAIWGALRWVNTTLDKAERTEVAEARVLEVEREKVELAKTFAAAAEINRGIGEDLAAFRAEESKRAEEWRQRLGSISLMREVKHVDPKTGVTTTRRERDPVQYRRLFNEAVTGTTDP
jgi:uncharacterized membrane-anchored protein YhcB (DUF1043 family)